MNPINRHPQGDAHTKEYVSFIHQLLRTECEYHADIVDSKMLPYTSFLTNRYAAV